MADGRTAEVPPPQRRSSMRVNATADVVRMMGDWARRADAGLARSAARNAAHSMNATRTREIDDARTMRDLQNIPEAETAQRQSASR
jgi:hypothetical protein